MLKEPQSMEELVYFTQRAIGKGKAKAWVYRQPCPKCKKALMGKPKDPKTGKPKVRAKEYVCSACEYTVEKIAYEETLQAEIKYVCPSCSAAGEISIQFKRKKVGGIDMLFFPCPKCNFRIEITKKMKTKKGKDDAGDEDV